MLGHLVVDDTKAIDNLLNTMIDFQKKYLEYIK